MESAAPAATIPTLPPSDSAETSPDPPSASPPTDTFTAPTGAASVAPEATVALICEVSFAVAGLPTPAPPRPMATASARAWLSTEFDAPADTVTSPPVAFTSALPIRAATVSATVAVSLDTPTDAANMLPLTAPDRTVEAIV